MNVVRWDECCDYNNSSTVISRFHDPHLLHVWWKKQIKLKHFLRCVPGMLVFRGRPGGKTRQCSSTEKNTSACKWIKLLWQQLSQQCWNTWKSWVRNPHRWGNKHVLEREGLVINILFFIPPTYQWYSVFYAKFSNLVIFNDITKLSYCCI